VSRLLAAVEHPCVAAEPHPPEPGPVVLVVVDEGRHLRPAAGVLDPPQRPRPLRLRVDGGVESVARECEHDWHKVWPTVGVDGRKPGDPRVRDLLPQYDRVVHLGLILPNFGEGSTPEGIRRMAEAAEELGIDSVWATEHIIVGPEAVKPYGRVYDPLVVLAWVAGFTERIGLGTSIVLLPLHHPIRLAKEVATLQELSAGRMRLGVGVGWHEDEFRFMGYEFRGRGRRADEALRLMRALWRGERTFRGEHWLFEDATFAPLPEPQPELWVGGGSERAIRRARELGDVWHPSRSVGPEAVHRVKERYRELRVVPRTRADQVEAFLEAGAEGAVVSLPDETSLRDFARRYR
jgi:probable F420-dependent oxidoreductase